MKPHHGRRGDPVWLADVLRHWGLTVREMPGWKNWGQGDFDDITHVIAHHTAGANTSPEYIARNPGLGHGLSSQIHLGRDGVVTLCGAGIAWHAGEGEFVAPLALRGYVTRPTATGPKQFTAANARSLGIEAVNAGDGSQPWPDVQMWAYHRTCAAICWYLGFPADNVLGHKEITPSQKIDPNFSMNLFRNDVRAHLRTPPGAAPPKKDVLDMDEAQLRNIIASEVYNCLRVYVGPIGSDVKDVREQLVGARDMVPDDLTASYPGWDTGRLLYSARRKGFVGLTVTEMAAVAISGTEQDKASAERAANGGTQ